MASWLRILVTLPEDLSSAPTTHIRLLYKCLQLQLQGILTPSSGLLGHPQEQAHTHT